MHVPNLPMYGPFLNLSPALKCSTDALPRFVVAGNNSRWLLRGNNYGGRAGPMGWFPRRSTVNFMAFYFGLLCLLDFLGVA